MDIYFCDLCGNRVNDFDLKSGRSIRRVHDVICATCLELGHGKEWLSKHQSKAKASVPFAHRNPISAVNSPAASRPSVPAMAAGASSASTPPASPAALAVIDSARDRAATFEGNDEQTVDASGMVHPLPVTLEGGDLIETPAAKAKGDRPTPRAASKPQPAPSNQLSSAAASFSALGSSPTKDPAAKHGSEDDLDEAAQPLIADSPTPAEPLKVLDDDSGSSPQLHDAIGDAVDEAERLERSEDPNQAKAREKAETLPSSPLQTNVEAPNRDRAKDGKAGKDGKEARDARESKASSPSTPSPSKKSQAQNKSGSTSKISKAKSGKSPARKRSKGSDMAVIVITCITLPLMALGMWYWTTRSSEPKEQVKENVDVKSALIKSLDDTRRQVEKSLNASTKDLKDIQLSIDMIRDINQHIDEFKSLATKNGWSEDQIEDEMAILHVQDVKKRMRELMEEKVKLSNPQ